MTLALAARYLRTLADVEQATAIGDTVYAWSLLDGIDPVDLRALVDEFEQAALAEREQDAGTLEALVIAGRNARRCAKEAPLEDGNRELGDAAKASSRSASAAHEIGGDTRAPDAPHAGAVTEEPLSVPPVAPVIHAGDNWKARCS